MNKKTVLVIAIIGALLTAFFLFKNYKERLVTIDKIQSYYTQGLERFNAFSKENNMQLTARQKTELTPTDTGGEIITRVFFTGLTDENDPITDETYCADIHTNIITKTGLGLTDIAKTTSTIISDAEKSDCLWLSELDSDPEARAFFEKHFNKTVPMILHSTHTVAGNSEYNFLLEEAKIAEEQGTIEWQTLSIAVDMNKDFNEFDYVLNWPGMAVTQTDSSNELTVGNLKGHGNHTAHSKNIWLGGGEMKLAQLTINLADSSSNEPIIIDASDIKILNDANLKNNKLNYEGSIEVDKARVLSKDYKLSYAFSVLNINPEPFEKYMQVIQTIDTGEELMDEEFQRTLVDNSMKSLSGSEITLAAIELSTTQDTLKTNLQVKVDDLNNLDAQTVLRNPIVIGPAFSASSKSSINSSPFVDFTIKFDDISDNEMRLVRHPMALLDKMAVNLDVNFELADLEALKRLIPNVTNANTVASTFLTQENLQPAIQAGILRQDGEKYTLKLKMNRSNITLNEQPVDPRKLRALIAQ